MTSKTKYYFLLLTLIVFTQCENDFEQPLPPSGDTIVDIASSSADFNILTSAITRTGLAGSLDNNNSGVFTVLAPTDAAFVTYFNTLSAAQLPPGSPPPGTLTEEAVLDIINNLLAASYNPPATSAITPASLAVILNYHITSTSITSDKIVAGEGRTTQNGARLSLSKQTGIIVNANRAGTAAGNGALVVTADIAASNGVIHSIDKVLNPVALANIWAGGTTGLPGFGVNYAVNPPIISYFGTAMPRNSDGSINIGSATVNTTEYQLISLAIIRGNIAPVIIPNQSPLPDFTLFSPRDADLVAYLGVADEVAARNTLNGLTPQAVADLVGYHLVTGRFVSSDFVDGQKVVTSSGADFEVDINGSTISLIDKNAAADPVVITGNVLTNAGVLHGLNSVLRSN